MVRIFHMEPFSDFFFAFLLAAGKHKLTKTTSGAMRRRAAQLAAYSGPANAQDEGALRQFNTVSIIGPPSLHLFLSFQYPDRGGYVRPHRRYKFIVPIPKVATVFLFLAIAPPHLRAFIACCKMIAAYMALYGVATTLVAVFQCGPDVSVNWMSPGEPGVCIDLPAFWYAQFAVDISACVVMIGLPWWLFAS